MFGKELGNVRIHATTPREEKSGLIAKLLRDGSVRTIRKVSRFGEAVKKRTIESSSIGYPKIARLKNN